MQAKIPAMRLRSRGTRCWHKNGFHRGGQAACHHACLWAKTKAWACEAMAQACFTCMSEGGYSLHCRHCTHTHKIIHTYTDIDIDYCTHVELLTFILHRYRGRQEANAKTVTCIASDAQLWQLSYMNITFASWCFATRPAIDAGHWYIDYSCDTYCAIYATPAGQGCAWIGMEYTVQDWRFQESTEGKQQYLQREAEWETVGQWERRKLRQMQCREGTKVHHNKQHLLSNKQIPINKVQEQRMRMGNTEGRYTTYQCDWKRSASTTSADRMRKNEWTQKSTH